jgi:hypothetical protein
MPQISLEWLERVMQRCLSWCGLAAPGIALEDWRLADELLAIADRQPTRF